MRAYGRGSNNIQFFFSYYILLMTLLCVPLWREMYSTKAANATCELKEKRQTVKLPYVTDYSPRPVRTSSRYLRRSDRMNKMNERTTCRPVMRTAGPRTRDDGIDSGRHSNTALRPAGRPRIPRIPRIPRSLITFYSAPPDQ